MEEVREEAEKEKEKAVVKALEEEREQAGKEKEKERAKNEAEKNELATKMLQAGLNVKVISDVLGLPTEEIEKLK